VNCLKALWLYTYKPELVQISDKSAENMQRGSQLGLLAQQLFPDGIEVELVKDGHAQMLQNTLELIKQGQETIYEATFCYNNILVRADIMRKDGNGWELYEVKSAWSVKPYHLHDLAVQYYVLSNCGVPLQKACIVHVNGPAKKAGETDPWKLFNMSDQTGVIQGMQSQIGQLATQMRQVLAGDEPAVPKGEQCVKPFACAFNNYC
jgi:hypothetical protein